MRERFGAPPASSRASPILDEALHAAHPLCLRAQELDEDMIRRSRREVVCGVEDASKVSPPIKFVVGRVQTQGVFRCINSDGRGLATVHEVPRSGCAQR